MKNLYKVIFFFFFIHLPKIEFTICTNQFILPIVKNDRGSLKLVSKMGFNYNKWNKNFLFNIPSGKTETTFSECSVAPGNFTLERPEKPFSFNFQADFQETFGTW